MIFLICYKIRSFFVPIFRSSLIMIHGVLSCTHSFCCETRICVERTYRLWTLVIIDNNQLYFSTTGLIFKCRFFKVYKNGTFCLIISYQTFLCWCENGGCQRFGCRFRRVWFIFYGVYCLVKFCFNYCSMNLNNICAYRYLEYYFILSYVLHDTFYNLLPFFSYRVFVVLRKSKTSLISSSV